VLRAVTAAAAGRRLAPEGGQARHATPAPPVSALVSIRARAVVLQQRPPFAASAAMAAAPGFDEDEFEDEFEDEYEEEVEEIDADADEMAQEMADKIGVCRPRPAGASAL